MSTSSTTEHIIIDPSLGLGPTRTQPHSYPTSLPHPESVKTKPNEPSHGLESGKLYFVGNATTIIEWHGVRIMTDPNFLHAGDHVHLGPGVTAERVKEPKIGIEELPRIDVVCLSHYHEDHFDRLVEDKLRRDLPIITTPHAHQCLTTKPEPFTSVQALSPFSTATLEIAQHSNLALHLKPLIKVTATPGKHVPPGPGGLVGKLNDFLGAVPPTNGWMIELGNEVLPEGKAEGKEGEWRCGYRIYISGDTLMVDELKEIPERYKDKKIDLMLVHLGETSIPNAEMPLLMVTMNAEQGMELVKLIDPETTLPIHFDDYSVMKPSRENFLKLADEAGLKDKVVKLERGDIYSFTVKDEKA